MDNSGSEHPAPPDASRNVSTEDLSVAAESTSRHPCPIAASPAGNEPPMNGETIVIQPTQPVDKQEEISSLPKLTSVVRKPGKNAKGVLLMSSTKSRLPWLDGRRVQTQSQSAIRDLRDNTAELSFQPEPTASHQHEDSAILESDHLEAPDANYKFDVPPQSMALSQASSSSPPVSTHEALSIAIKDRSNSPQQSSDDTILARKAVPGRNPSTYDSDNESIRPPSETGSIARHSSSTSPPVPSMGDLARQLALTDSTTVHMTDTTEEYPLNLSGHSVREDDFLAPFPSRPIRISVNERSLNSSEDSMKTLRTPEPAQRRISLALQPLRKVTMSQRDAIPRSRQGSSQSRSERLRSISLQPVRTKKEPLKDYKQGKKQRASQERSVDDVPPDRVAQTLRDSIAGLESLMQEAVRLAKVAADHENPREIPVLLEEAKFALARSSEVQDNTRPDVNARLSSSSSSGSSSSESDSSDVLEALPQLPMGRGALPSTLPTPEAAHISSSLKTFSLPTVGSDDSSGRLSPKSVPSQAQPATASVQQRGSASSRQPATRTIDWAYASEGFSNREQLSTLAPRYRGSASQESQLHRRVTFIESHDGSIQASEDFMVDRNRNSRLGVNQATTSGLASPVTRFIPGLVRDRSDSSRPLSQHDGQDATDEPASPLQTSPGPVELPQPTLTKRPTGNWGRDKFDETDFKEGDFVDVADNGLKGKHHISLRDGQKFSLHKGYKRQPIARNWGLSRKRWTAAVACINTALVGILIGIYAGEVPAIQYALADQHHHIILGNVALYLGLGITTLLFWPLPLLHGRKPYTLGALVFALPLQFPQAIVVSTQHNSNYNGYRVGLLLSRAFSGLALGFAQINFLSTLLDLFGASLQSNQPHGEIVIVNDIRRHGGGMGLWLGFWAWAYIASISIGFMVGAEVIAGLNPEWGFYICVILLAIMLFLNIITPETRRSPHRRTMQEVELPNESISRRVARGEIKMHVSGDGPKWWWEEVIAGIYLSWRMVIQTGFLVMAVYVAWIYAEIVLIIVLLGNLLSKDYRFRPDWVGLGVLSVAIGAALAVPNSKANLFSRSRSAGPRTDSMTFQPRISWTSHLVRRAIFMITLPIAGIAYTLASTGTSVSFMAPITFAALIGYISNLAIAECNGIIMETFDTSDLQPGANSRHRLQSLTPETRRKRTTYSSYPRVTAGMMVSQGLGFLFAAAATGVGGAVTRHVGAQKATAITAAILMGLTILLTCILWRFKPVQVIPNELFGQFFGSKSAGVTGTSEVTDSGANGGSRAADRKASMASMDSARSWRAVIIGNPSGKMRRMSWLELGSLSRWTEIRRLNRLLSRSTTQALNTGWR